MTLEEVLRLPLAEILRLAEVGAKVPPPAPVKDRLLNVREAAPRLGIKPATLYQKADEYPFTIHDKRSLRFSEKGIEEWIERNRR